MPAAAKKKSTKKGRRVTRNTAPLPGRPGAAVELDPGPGATARIAMSSPSDPEDEYWAEVYTDCLKNSLALFAKDILKMEVSPHIESWSNLVNEQSRLAVLAARDHGKSAFFSYAYPIWRAWSEPGCEVYLFSKTLEQAQDLLSIIVYGLNNLMGVADIPELAYLMPTQEDFRTNPRVRLNKSDVIFTNGSRIRCVGYGKAIRGRHPKYVVLDDVLNDEDMWSETERRKHISYYQSAIVNMVMPSTQGEKSFEGGQAIIVGTPYHMADLYAWLEQNEVYAFGRYPGITQTPKGPRALFPWRWSLEQLYRKKKEIGSVAFSREILCCRPGTMIETISGSVPIEEIQAGDMVLTHTGKWGRVKQTFEHEHSGELIQLKSMLQVTANHPVLTPDGWIPAGALAATDQVTFPSAMPTAPLVSSVSLIEGSSIPFLRTADFKRVYPRGASKQLPSGSVGKAGAKSVPEEVPITKDLMRLFGLWLAEGHVACRNIYWSFGYHETETLARETADLVKRVFGREAKICPHEDKGTTIVRLGSNIVGDFFTRTFGSLAHGKLIPTWVKDLAPEHLWELILGYSDGDGHVDAKGSARLASVSFRLLRDVRFMLARCGIFASIRKTHDGGSDEIMGRPVMRRPSWLLSITGGGYVAFKHRELPARPFCWSRIHTSLKQVPYTGLVHNFEVEGDNSYVADGVAVHNCLPITDDISMFPSYLFPPLYDHQLTLRPTRAEIEARQWECYMGVDIARSASVGADFFVIFTVAKDPTGHRFIVNINRTKGLPFKRQLELIASEAERYNPSLVYIESNAMQQIYTDEMRRMTDIPVREFLTLATNKYPLDKGVPGLRILLENQKLTIPRGDDYSRQQTDIWQSEASQFGFIDGKLQGIGVHDDTVMAWWFAEEAAKAGGFSFAFGDEEGQDAFDTPEGEGDEAYEDILLGDSKERGETLANLF